MRLASRTREADAATRSAAIANRDALNSQQQAAASLQVAAVSQQQAGDAERHSQALEAQLRELNAKKTERGLVITIGDLLFDTDQTSIKSGGVRNIERLSGFLKEYPQRKASIEGYTDSTGSDSHNQTLSERRAEAVRSALLGLGVPAGQLTAQGYGETHPVAGNESSSGRQLNRRVEIVLSDEHGAIAPR
jgi:outer membrane protein OmpA-like peptidoglycan-associated protein